MNRKYNILNWAFIDKNKINEYQDNIIGEFGEQCKLIDYIENQYNQNKNDGSLDKAVKAYLNGKENHIEIKFKIEYLNIHCYFRKNNHHKQKYKLSDIKINLYLDYFMLWANENNQLWCDDNNRKKFEKTLRDNLKINDPIKDLAYIFYINVFHGLIDEIITINPNDRHVISDSNKLINYINENYIKENKYFKELKLLKKENQNSNEEIYLVMGTTLKYNKDHVYCVFKGNELFQIRTKREYIAGNNDKDFNDSFPYLEDDDLPLCFSISNHFNGLNFPAKNIYNNLSDNILSQTSNISTHVLTRFIERFNALENIKTYFNINFGQNEEKDEDLKEIIKLILCNNIKSEIGKEEIIVDNHEKVLYIDLCAPSIFPNIETSIIKKIKLPKYFIKQNGQNKQDEYYYLVISVKNKYYIGQRNNSSNTQDKLVDISTIYNENFHTTAIKKFWPDFTH